ncbi:MAG TPA: response regulator transcription factor [Candidatus Acidoferrum sp.]|nr:response regulator transcription factor [Candidatus Acidoferrum sp.]
MGSRAKVLILCVNRLLRESIARILTKRTDFEIVTAQMDSSAFCEQVLDSRADVLVLDSLDFLLGHFDLSSSAAAHNHCVKPVLIAMTDDRSSFLTAIRRGARGYVLQNASAVDVVSAVRAVAEGHAVCPPHYTEVLFDYVATQTAELPNSQRHAQWGLTQREQQLIPLIGRGLSNKEIANHLNLSEQTVKNHVHRILRKVGVSDRLSIYEVCQNRNRASRTAPAA